MRQKLTAFIWICKFPYILPWLLVGAGVCYAMNEASPRPTYPVVRSLVDKDGKVLVNMEVAADLKEDDKKVEVILRFYRPGKPVQKVNVSIDI